MSSSSVQWIAAFVARGLSGPEEVLEDWSWAARQSSAAGPRSLAASLRSKELAGVERQGTERRRLLPHSQPWGLFVRPPSRVLPTPLPSKTSVTAPPSHVPRRLGLPPSRHHATPGHSLTPEPPVWLPGHQPESHHITHSDFPAEVPGGVITSQAFWVSQGLVLVEETDFPCLCGLAHHLSLSCDLPLISPSAWDVPTSPYSVQ